MRGAAVSTEREARKLLGEWLAAEPGRTWDHSARHDLNVRLVVWLTTGARNTENFQDHTEAEGPTLADAILNALDLVNNHDEPNGPDNVTREDFARDEWRR